MPGVALSSPDQRGLRVAPNHIASSCISIPRPHRCLSFPIYPLLLSGHVIAKNGSYIVLLIIYHILSISVSSFLCMDSVRTVAYQTGEHSSSAEYLCYSCHYFWNWPCCLHLLPFSHRASILGLSCSRLPACMQCVRPMLIWNLRCRCIFFVRCHLVFSGAYPNPRFRDLFRNVFFLTPVFIPISITHTSFHSLSTSFPRTWKFWPLSEPSFCLFALLSSSEIWLFPTHIPLP